MICRLNSVHVQGQGYIYIYTRGLGEVLFWVRLYVFKCGLGDVVG